MPSRTPQAEHRDLLVQPLGGLEQALVVRVLGVGLLVERDLDRQLGLVGQELVQRRVEISLMVTGKPSIASRMPRKSSRRSGRSSASAAS